MKYNTSIEPLEFRIAPAVIYAVETGTNKLVSFDSDAPEVLLTDRTITGIPAGEFVEGIDIAPTSGVMYAIALKDDGATRSGSYYTIDTATAVATKFSPYEPSGLPDTASIGFEAKPYSVTYTTTDDRYDYSIYAPSSSGGGGFTFNNPTGNETVAAIAFSDIFGNNDRTYAYNYISDELVTIADNHDLVPVARVTLGGANFFANSSIMGFDISQSPVSHEQGWLSIYKNSNGTHLYSIDLATAALTDHGAIGNSSRNFGGLTVSVVDPAPAIVGQKATWTDADGDTVTLTVSKGTLTAENFYMLDAGQGSFLGKLTLGAGFEGANLTIAAKAGPQGDGQVNMGYISAYTIGLGAVKIGGVISGISAGASAGPSMKSLVVNGIDSSLYYGGGSRLANGADSVLIKGNLSGGFTLDGPTKSFTVTGNLDGGFIGGFGDAKSIVVKGNVIGGSVGTKSGKSLKIGGSLVGFGAYTGRIYYQDGVGSVTIGGHIVGGDGERSGVIQSSGVTTVKIGGSIFGGSGDGAGSIQLGTAKSITVGGSIIASNYATKDLEIAASRMGAVVIKGGVIGTAASPVHIVAQGKFSPATQAEATAIGSVSIGGDLTHAHIGAGVDASLTFAIVDAAIGKVKIGGSMTASSITAGIAPVNGIAGDANDTLGGGNMGNAAIVAKIASITIRGQLHGTTGGGQDYFGIEAEQIGALTIGKVKAPLTTGKDDLTLGFTSDVRVREL